MRNNAGIKRLGSKKHLRMVAMFMELMGEKRDCEELDGEEVREEDERTLRCRSLWPICGKVVPESSDGVEEIEMEEQEVDVGEKLVDEKAILDAMVARRRNVEKVSVDNVHEPVVEATAATIEVENYGVVATEMDKLKTKNGGGMKPRRRSTRKFRARRDLLTNLPVDNMEILDSKVETGQRS